MPYSFERRFYRIINVKNTVLYFDPLAYITLNEVADIFSVNHS